MVTGFFTKMKNAIAGTKQGLLSRMENLLLGEKRLDEQTLEQLEAALIATDMGVRTANEILERVRREIGRDQTGNYGLLLDIIKSTLLGILESAPVEKPRASSPDPEVIFMVGVNGAGKTTTIGKLAHRLSLQGRKVLICASDTFRAAAIEQLAIWAERSGTALVRKDHGADPAAVLFDSLERAQQEGADAVIVDTAGRLHTKVNLMKELEKLIRVASRKIPGAPHRVYLAIDATTGQNGLAQAREFLRTSGVTGLIVTKLDGTAKGGVIVAIAKDLSLPISYVGVGEKIDDLIDFNPEDFVESLFSK